MSQGPGLELIMASNHTRRLPGNEIDGFIEGLTENDRPVPTALTASTIKALPVVKITENHPINITHCPICKDEFKISDDNDTATADDDQTGEMFFRDIGFVVDDLANGLTWLQTLFLSSWPIRALSHR
ncbi:hypothetical protein V6N13_018317 [Hibiscus sabdariffa]|uniref:Uncharacterized protein n=1 Tax=Hibiscus sabdariffa TaxID=183260 RepID=A0ABR2EMC2_9ROSI